MESEKLDIFSIIHGMFLSLDNAQALIDDSQLLFQNGKVPRTFVLAQLANEEIGKAFILYNLYMALKIDENSVDYKAIRKSFYDHKTKTFEATMADFMLVSEKKLTKKQTNIAVQEICDEIVKGREDYNVLKNRGLYVSFDNNKFVSPSDSITEQEASDALKKAIARKEITYKMAAREVDFDLEYGTHPRFHIDSQKANS